MTDCFDRDCWLLLGLPFDAVDMDTAADKIQTAVNKNAPCFLSTPNINFAIAAQDDQAFYESVMDSHLSVADGMPLIWLAKLLGLPIQERVAGSDLFDHMTRQQPSEAIKVFFFGGQAGVAERAHMALNGQAGGVVSCGYYEPGFVSVEEMSSEACINAINATKPDFVLVALGAKKGQAWIQKNREKLQAPVISHLGAVINFVAGTVERAPRFWRQAGMEWLWRIKQEPSLWKRYWADGLALTGLLCRNVIPLAIYDRVASRTQKANVTLSIEQNQNTTKLIGSLKQRDIETIRTTFKKLVTTGQMEITLDLSELTYMDSAAMAQLLLLHHHLHKQGRSLQISQPSKTVARLLRLAGVFNRIRVTSAKPKVIHSKEL